jgi:hypothetical protein
MKKKKPPKKPKKKIENDTHFLKTKQRILTDEEIAELEAFRFGCP